jgi:DNA-binding NarL/FixJ family response regulator
MDAIEVAIVEDDAVIREGLALLIDGTHGFRCQQTFGSVEEALEAKLSTPQVVLLDIHLPGLPGSEGVAKILEVLPSAHVLMLTVYEGQDKVFESLCHGASGYLLKKTPPAKLLDAIREVHEGGSPMSPEIARKVLHLFRQVRPKSVEAHDLTPREVQLLKLLAGGHSYAGAGAELHVGINTIRNYIRSIYDKLQVHSKSEAVSKAIKQKII